MTDPVTCVSTLTQNGQWFSPLAILVSAGVIKHFKESEAYIHDTRKERKENKKAYICFQELAEKWDGEKQVEDDLPCDDGQK